MDDVTTQVTVSGPRTETTFVDNEFCRADTENNKTIETTVRTYTDITTVTTTTITATTPVTTVTYSDGSTEVIRGSTTETTVASDEVTTATREEIVSEEIEEPMISVEWTETVETVTGEPITATEFVGESTVRTNDDENDRWVDTTTTVYQDTTATDTETTTTRTPIYTITYCDGTVETETGVPVITTAVTTETVTALRETVIVNYEDYPPPPPPPSDEFRYGISYVAFEYLDFDTGETEYIKFNFTVDSNQVNDVFDLAAYVGSKYGDVTDIFVHTGGSNEITGVKGDNFYGLADDGTIVPQATAEQFPTGRSGQVTGVETVDYPPADLYTFEPELPEDDTVTEPEPETPVEPEPETPVEPEPEPETPAEPEPEPEPETPVDPAPETPVDPVPETPAEPEVLVLDLTQFNLPDNWDRRMDDFYRLVGNDTEGWVIQLDQDGPARGKNGKAYDWTTVADNVDPESVQVTESVINYSEIDPPPNPENPV